MIKLISCGVVLLCITLTTSAKDYLGAELYSKNAVKYGRFDIRMRMVSANGIVSLNGRLFLRKSESYCRGSPAIAIFRENSSTGRLITLSKYRQFRD